MRRAYFGFALYGCCEDVVAMAPCGQGGRKGEVALSNEYKVARSAGGSQLAAGPSVFIPAWSTCTYRSIWVPSPSCIDGLP